MKRKKLFNSLLSLLLCLVMVFTLAGCGAKGPEKEISNLINELCKAMKNLDIKKLAEIAGQDASEVEALTEDDSMPGVTELIKKIAGTLEYKIGEITVDGDSAKAPVHFKYQDISEPFVTAFSNYMIKVLELAFSSLAEGTEPTEEELAQMFADYLTEALDGAEKKMSEVDVVFPLAKTSEGNWQITNTPEQLLDILTGNIFSSLENLDLGF